MSLDPVRQKIARSAELLKSATAEVQRYMDSKPGEVKGEIDPTGGRAILRFVANKPVPDIVSIILGDAIQNLRSALDYLVWELVLAAKGSPTEKHMFPICDTEDAFNQQLRRGRLDGVPVDAVAEIQGLQPFHSAPDAAMHLLRILDNLCNVNKHRRIVLIALAAHYSRTEITGAAGHSVQATLDPRYHGAEIAISPALTTEGEIEMAGDASYFVTFNEGVTSGIRMSDCVNQLWHFVDKEVVPRFERFFV